MKTIPLLACGVFVVLFCVASAHADCPGGPSYSCVTSFNFSPGTIAGDQSGMAAGVVSAHLGTGTTQFLLELSIVSNGYLSDTICGSGAIKFQGGCRYLNMSPGDVTVYFYVIGYNQTGANQTTVMKADALYFNDPGVTAQIVVTPIPNPSVPPDQNADCDTCTSMGSPTGAHPINFASGNTWITHQDYSIPGLGGGMALSRTWTSLWPLRQPPETSGIFGHSWRSNFEERVQVLTGGAVKYWKGDGNALFYAYSGFGGAYYMTAPADDQTTLSFDSGTTLWTVTQKDGRQKIFNNAGYLTSIIDRNGNTTSIVVDAANQNRIASVTDPAGRTLTFSYTNPTFPRLCTSIADSVGTVATYTYDTSGRLTRVAYADGSQFNFGYDSNNLILSVTDSQSKVLESHTYDSQRRGLTSQQANGVNKVTAVYPTASPWKTAVLNSLNTGVWLTFAAKNQRQYLTQVSSGPVCATCGFKQTTQAAFAPSSVHFGSYVDSNGNRSYLNHDAQGNLTSNAAPIGNPVTGITSYATWNYAYNSFGQVTSATDPLGNVTTNQYDVHGNLLSTTTPSPDGGTTPGSTTSFQYDSQGQLTRVTDPLNHQTNIAYYPSGLIHTITDTQNNVTTYVYDARGNRTSVTDAASNQTQFQYDSMSRLTLITYPDQSTVQFGYDYRGRRASVTDQNQKTTTYAYDDADRLTSVTDAQTPTHGVTRYVYNTENHLTDIYDANNRQTHFTYSSGYFLSMTTFPSNLYETYNWDNLDQMTRRTDRKGNAIYYYYDYQNQLYKKTYPDSSTVNYTYDAAGRLTQVQDKNYLGNVVTGTYGFAYDNMGRLTQTTTNYVFDTAGTYTVQYAHDAASNRATMTDPQSGATHYYYDTLNRLSSLNDPQSNNFTFQYDALSRRTQLTRPNGVNTNYAYDNVSRLLSVLHQLNGATLDGASYTYDSAGNRTSKTNQLSSVTEGYGYDAIYQLLQVTQGTTTTESYTYDPVGNRLSSLGVSPYAYNPSNQLTSIPGTTHTYDNNGNTKTKVAGTSTTTYNWDFENRLTQVVNPGVGTTTFRYDPFGRRIQKSGPLGTTTYLYDGRNLLEELDASGNVLARYNQGPSIDEPISELRGSTTSYYQIDFLGSVTSLSNSAGALANTYTYDSFGKLTASTGTLTNPFQFTGREFDPETGIYNYRFRYYDQNVGRFLSEDPIMFGGGVNFFRYADGNPVSEADPLGLDTKVCYYSDAAASFGHVGFGLPQEGEQGTQGFYPTGNPIDSPGKVKPDEQKKPQCKTIPAPKDKDQCMLQCRLRRVNNPGNYKVTSRQCTSFVRECLRECGEPAGDYNGPRPWPFFDGLPK